MKSFGVKPWMIQLKILLYLYSTLRKFHIFTVRGRPEMELPIPFKSFGKYAGL